MQSFFSYDASMPEEVEDYNKRVAALRNRIYVKCKGPAIKDVPYVTCMFKAILTRDYALSRKFGSDK